MELAAAAPARTPVAGLDLGEKTIGVAVSDTSRMIASPLELIRKTQFTKDAERLFALMAGGARRPLVIGLPVNMDGSEGPRCQSVRAFARNILRLREMPIAFWDERMSTMAVQRMMTAEHDLSQAPRPNSWTKTAAAYILQGCARPDGRGLRGGRAMINGAHVIIYSKDAEADRAFLRDVLGFRHVDVGHGWLIFALPEAEVAVHPGDEGETHELYLMTDDVNAEITILTAKGVACEPVNELRWGPDDPMSPCPAAAAWGIYEPKHPRP